MKTARATWASEEETRRAWKILKSTGAYREGHFVYEKTGYHYDRFFQLPLAYQFSQHARTLAVALARMMRRSGLVARLNPNRTFTLVAPSDVALPMAFWAGEVLGADRVLWMTQKKGEPSFHQFVELGERDQVIIVSDIMFSGEQVSHALSLIQSAGACVHGIVVIVDRREEKRTFNGVEVISLLQTASARYPADSCPLCNRGVELTQVQEG